MMRNMADFREAGDAGDASRIIPVMRTWAGAGAGMRHVRH